MATAGSEWEKEATASNGTGVGASLGKYRIEYSKMAGLATFEFGARVSHFFPPSVVTLFPALRDKTILGHMGVT